MLINANPFREGPPITPAECNPLTQESHQVSHSGIDCTDPAAVRAYYEALKIREARSRRQ